MEGFACHTIEEEIASFPECSKKIMILINENPLPGFFSCLPMDTTKVPHMFFLPIKTNLGCIEEKIWRINIELKKEKYKCFEATYSYLTLFNIESPCIRLDMTELKDVHKIIEKFENVGIVFKKYKKIKSYKSIIKVRQFLKLTDFVSGVYKGEKEDYYYIEVPGKLKWDNFYKMILSIRGSRKFNNFDAIQTSFYRKDKINEFVRVYTKSFKEEDFIKLKDELQTYSKRYCDKNI